MADALVLSLRDLQKHLVKTIVGSIATSILVVILGLVAFYYNTTYSVKAIQEKQTEMAITLDKHTDLINKATQNVGMSEVQQTAFNQRLNTIEESQKQIISILLEIKRNN